MNLDDAVTKHGEWRVRFRTAIKEQEPLDAGAIGKADHCELGRWLQLEGKTSHGRLPAHLTCVVRHAAFHSEAGKVAAAINEGRYAEAEKMLAVGTTFMNASVELAASILALKREAHR